MEATARGGHGTWKPQHIEATAHRGHSTWSFVEMLSLQLLLASQNVAVAVCLIFLNPSGVW